MNDLFENNPSYLVQKLCRAIEKLGLAEKIETINMVRTRIHEISPFKDEPIDLVLWVPILKVQSNDYNPNTVASPEIKLLKKSIKNDGYTQPVVVWPIEKDSYEVVDGFHRTKICKEDKDINKKVLGHVPVTTIKQNQQNIKDRMASTIRHNRARGVHGVMPMTEIVAKLLSEGWTDADIAAELGMCADEVLRFKQTKGIPELFKDHEYSKSWK